MATRMMGLTPKQQEFEIREIEMVALPEPPQPNEEIIDEPPPPPPPPAVVDLRSMPEMSQPALPVTRLKMDPRLAVDTFFSDQPPSPLPVVKVRKPRPLVKPSKPKVARPVVRKTPPKPKSQYSLGELDRKPRLIRNPSVTFPRNIRNANKGRVVVRVAILPSGRSQYISTISSTHPALTPLARRIASGSRFTPPTRQGKPVKAVMTWPIIIKK